MSLRIDRIRGITADLQEAWLQLREALHVYSIDIQERLLPLIDQGSRCHLPNMQNAFLRTFKMIQKENLHDDLHVYLKAIADLLKDVQCLQKRSD
jgi:hypothetical protein